MQIYLYNSVKYTIMNKKSSVDISNSGAKKFFKPSIAVDVVLLTIDHETLKVLLIERSRAPFSESPALPGGFIKENETSRDAAERILRDKAGVANVYIEQLFTFDSPSRDPRGAVITVAHYAIVSYEKISMQASDKTEHPEFVSTLNLPRLAFDHNEIIEYALGRLRSKFQYTNLSYSLLPESFTLSELQKIYEVVLGKKLDKRNFRKKFLQLDLIEETGKTMQGRRQRPARQYKFKRQQLAELKKFF